MWLWWGGIWPQGTDDRIAAMKSVHLLVPDLFLPADIAAEAGAGLVLPALERMLVRGASTCSARTDLSDASLEGALCGLFLESACGDTPVAAVSAAFDGLGSGYWLRADPAYMRLHRTQLVMQPATGISADEAAQFCVALNEHFAGQGMTFVAPHPQRWYVRLDQAADVRTVPLSQASGRDVRGLLPEGAEGARWQQLFNEMQMLLFAHPQNEVREARGELPVNSAWLWGSGVAEIQEPCSYGSVSSDEELAEMFAAAAGTPFSGWSEQWRSAVAGEQLLVWTGLRRALQQGDLDAWRAALQAFEINYAQPLWEALRAGEIAQLKLDVLGENGMRRIRLHRVDAWSFWRRPQRLATHSIV